MTLLKSSTDCLAGQSVLHRVAPLGKEGLAGVLESQNRGITDLGGLICRTRLVHSIQWSMQQPLRELVGKFTLFVLFVKVCSKGWLHRAEEALGAFWSH